MKDQIALEEISKSEREKERQKEQGTHSATFSGINEEDPKRVCKQKRQRDIYASPNDALVYIGSNSSKPLAMLALAFTGPFSFYVAAFGLTCWAMKHDNKNHTNKLPSGSRPDENHDQTISDRGVVDHQNESLSTRINASPIEPKSINPSPPKDVLRLQSSKPDLVPSGFGVSGNPVVGPQPYPVNSATIPSNLNHVSQSFLPGGAILGDARHFSNKSAILDSNNITGDTGNSRLSPLPYQENAKKLQPMMPRPSPSSTSVAQLRRQQNPLIISFAG